MMVCAEMKHCTDTFW